MMGFIRRLFSRDPLADFTDDQVSRAALDIIHPLPKADDSFWGGTLDRCDEVARRIADLRAKYSGFEPRRMRKAIVSWCDYADRELAKARADVVSQKHRLEIDAHSAKRAKEDARIRALHALLKATHHTP